MNKAITAICILAILSFTSCKKDEFGYLSQSHPDVPVTVSNLFGMFNGVPTVSTSVAGGGNITIILEIPASTGRTIKEITRVGLSTTTANYKVVEVSTGLYNTAPIPGKGTTATFTTTLAAYNTFTGLTTTATPGGATTFLARYFMFQLTLDNGDIIYPVGVRVYVDK